MSNSDWTIHATINDKALIKSIENLINDDVMLQVHTLFAKLINDYVPSKSGAMSKNVEITPEYVRYPGPYAHYQYVGEVYGPNFPILNESGNQVIGWRSPAGKGSKHPTGRKLGTEGELLNEKGEVIWKFGYTKDMHPLASSQWDKVALHAKLPLFEKGVQEILKRRAKELYG